MKPWLVITLSLSRKEFHAANKVATLLEKQTVASRPYELGLTLKYNKYTLERARTRRCADENGPVKAFSQLEITSYWDFINHKAWLTS